MKKLGLLVMPLMAVSLLASCNNGGDTPGPSGTFTITLKNDGDPDKKIENIKAGSIVEDVPDPTTPRADSTFIGWCTDNESKYPFDFSKIKIYQDYTLYSGWKDNRPSTCKVTYDAGDGKFPNGEQKISFKLDSGTKLLPYIKALIPTLEDQTFAYYEYEGKEDLIDYDDVVTSDITVKANYLPAASPTSDLNDFDWQLIKKIAVTGDPTKWFNVGATKTIEVNGEECDVRIIGFNYDYTNPKNPEETKVGITFDFVKTISGFTTAWCLDGGSEASFDFINNSDLNDCLQPSGEVYNMMPPELTKVIATVNKKVDIHPDDDWIEGNYDTQLFPLSKNEIDDLSSDHYEYYSDFRRLEKDAWYWLRSPDTSGAFNTAFHYENNVICVAGTGQSFAVAPAFCI